MKSPILSLFVAVFVSAFGFAQTDVIVNGSFEDPSTPFASWVSSVANGNLWGGAGGCGGSDGTDYLWGGDQNELTGFNNLIEDIGQEVTLPSNTNAATLYFDASINTDEGGATAYDYLTAEIQNSSGATIEALGTLSNTSGDAGFGGGCQTWAGYFVNIPSNYWGSTFRIAFKFETDGSNPTIFRLDNVELLYTTSGGGGGGCNYALSNTAYNTGTSAAGTYDNISSVSVETGCSWSANVTSGATWLSSSSSGTGNGSISVTTTVNGTGSSRSGTVEVEGLTLTITQPAIDCPYALSQTTFKCPSYLSGSYFDIAEIITDNECGWSAVVTSGDSWLATSSSSAGPGFIDISVSSNNTGSSRLGTIAVGTETLTVLQPKGNGPLGINDLDEATIKLFPNPATTQLTLQASEGVNGATFEVFDFSGRLIETGRISGTTHMLNVESYQSGAYYMSIQTEQGVERLKFIKD